MKLITLLLMTLSLSVVADTGQQFINVKVKAVSELYSDGYAQLVTKSIKYRTLHNEGHKSCVNVASFFMEGFSGGNNSAQFLLLLSCTNNKNGELSVQGIHPFYHFRNHYELSTASYQGKTITIDSQKGSVSFTNKYSIWWSRTEQNGI